MPAMLLPPRGELAPAIADPAAPWQLFCLIRGDADPLADLSAMVAAAGGRVDWSGRIDDLFIGAGEPYWTHAAMLSFPMAATTLTASAERGVAIGARDALVLPFRREMPPAPVMVLFRLLRPLGWLLDPGDEHLAEKRMPHGEGGVHPTREQIERRAADRRSIPAYFINLLAYRDRAAYPASQRRGDVSGRRAYLRYGIVAVRSVSMTGGRPLYVGPLGPPLVEGRGAVTAGRWDELAIVEYPSPRAALKLDASPGYAAALRHRIAGLERTVLLVAT
jgi:uncharacterized protein (DUF1330 family)